MRIYCLACREHTNNIGSKNVTMTNKVIRDKSRCAQCLSDKSRFMKQNSIKKESGVLHNKHDDILLKCKRNTKNIDAKMKRTKNGRVILSSKCVIYGNKKSRFIKEQVASGILSSVLIRTPLSKILVLGDIFF